MYRTIEAFSKKRDQFQQRFVECNLGQLIVRDLIVTEGHIILTIMYPATYDISYSKMFTIIQPLLQSSKYETLYKGMIEDQPGQFCKIDILKFFKD